MKYLFDFKQISNYKFTLIFTVLIVDIAINIFKKERIVENSSANFQMEFDNIEEFDKEILLPIQTKLEGYIEINKDEQMFLNGLIRKVKPKKLLKLGLLLEEQQ